MEDPPAQRWVLAQGTSQQSTAAESRQVQVDTVHVRFQYQCRYTSVPGRCVCFQRVLSLELLHEATKQITLHEPGVHVLSYHNLSPNCTCSWTTADNGHRCSPHVEHLPPSSWEVNYNVSYWERQWGGVTTILPPSPQGTYVTAIVYSYTTVTARLRPYSTTGSTPTHLSSCHGSAWPPQSICIHDNRLKCLSELANEWK